MRRALCALGLAAVTVAVAAAPASAAYGRLCNASEGVGVVVGTGSPGGGDGIDAAVCL